jgi:hypothetical protein
MKKKVLYVGLDVHKKTTDVAIATGRSNGKVRSYGKIDISRNMKFYLSSSDLGYHKFLSLSKSLLSWS